MERLCCRLGLFLALMSLTAFALLAPNQSGATDDFENQAPAVHRIKMKKPQSFNTPEHQTKIPQDWWSAAGENIQQSEYQLTWQEQTKLPEAPAAWQANNRAKNLRTYFLPEGIRITSRNSKKVEWTSGLALKGYGYAGEVYPVEKAELFPSSNRMEYHRGNLTEWYVNDKNGLEQGFTLSAPPPQTKEPAHEFWVVLRMEFAGDLKPRVPSVSGGSDDTANPGLSCPIETIKLFNKAGQCKLQYGQLYAFDCKGRELPARFVVSANAIDIWVDTDDAQYPIIVDPFFIPGDWWVESDVTFSELGASVAAAGDVNNDGYDDVIVGAPRYDNGVSSGGAAFVYYGSETGLSSTADWTVVFPLPDARFGASVATAGDVNADGCDDVIVGAYSYESGEAFEGAAFVFYGSTGGLIETPAWIVQSNQAGAAFGTSVGTAGDVNNDGFDDVIVGAPYYNNAQSEGAVFVYYGSATGLGTDPGWTGESDQGGAEFGTSVGTAGDVNGDGCDDVIVGAPSYDNGTSVGGAAFAYYGPLSGVSSSADWTVAADLDSAKFGWSVGTAGDVNKDGYDDVIVGAPYYADGEPYEGAAFAYYGSVTGLNSTADWATESNVYAAELGWSVGAAGDINSDGYDDIIVGAKGDLEVSGPSWVSIYNGSSSGLKATPDWTDASVADAEFGYSVGTAGDVNGDGDVDVIIGAPYYGNGSAIAYYGPFAQSSSPPAVEVLQQMGVTTWTTPGSFVVLNHWIRVIDHGGIASDGSSHNVTVTYPNGGAIKSLYFHHRIDPYSAIYSLWDDSLSQPIGEIQYSGDYTYRVENSDGEFGEATDNLQVDPINPPDEHSFSVAFPSPQNITAIYDDVYTDGTLYDDFESGYDPAKWNPLPGEVTIAGGQANVTQSDVLGSKSTWLGCRNPASINSIKANANISSSSGYIPRARIGGYFFNEDGADVWACVQIRDSEASYYLGYDEQVGNHVIWRTVVPTTVLGPIDISHTYEMSIGWDGTSLSVRVQGLEDAYDYQQTYIPSGSLDGPQVYQFKGIGVRSNLSITTDTPTFNWAPVAGANHYEVRISNSNGVSLYTGNVKDPPFELPPGVLLPDGTYKYNIWAVKDHQFFEIDNMGASDLDRMLFDVYSSQTQDPFIDLDSVGVYSWTSPPPVGADTFFYVRIHDAQGVPGNIRSVKVTLPGGREINMRYSLQVSNTCAEYEGAYYANAPSGTYTFTVIDKDGHTSSTTEDFNAQPLDVPVIDDPANNEEMISPNFFWQSVAGAPFYRIKIFDKDQNQLLNIRTTDTNLAIPMGILKDEGYYFYEVQSRGEFWEDNFDNGAGSATTFQPNWFFTNGKTGGVTAPTIDLQDFGVAVWRPPHPETEAPITFLEFIVAVGDGDGVPENIQRVEVTYPDGTTIDLLHYRNIYNGGNYYSARSYDNPDLIQDTTNSTGVYTFRVIDFDGNEVVQTDTLPPVADNVLGPITIDFPTPDEVVDISIPTIQWQGDPRADHYRVRLFEGGGYHVIFQSDPVSGTSYTVPAGVLQADSTYSVRVYAFPAPTEVDFYSSSSFVRLYDRYFTISENPTLVQLVSFTATANEDHVLLCWTTASEPSTIGFHLWRCTSDEDCVRITDDMIIAQGSTAWGASYSYLDYTALPGESYFYKVEEIDSMGQSNFCEPILFNGGEVNPPVSPVVNLQPVYMLLLSDN